MIKCYCGNDTFDTTKTVNFDLTVKMDNNGSIEALTGCENSALQPDEPYYTFSCTKCNRSYSYDELIKVSRYMEDIIEHTDLTVEQAKDLYYAIKHEHIISLHINEDF